LQAPQPALQALLQQTPSTQKPLLHWLAREQGLPRPPPWWVPVADAVAADRNVRPNASKKGEKRPMIRQPR
jgi:hypothetical protein